MREKVIFPTNVPVTVTLAFENGGFSSSVIPSP